MALFKRKYKRLVDQIYLKPTKKDPRITNVALDVNKMNTLTYYSSNYPEKVVKLANYFHQKISRQVKSKRYDYIDVSLQALDILLALSPAHAYNVYAEHFLVLAASMLETDDLIIQQVATRSMEKFAAIKEETSLYYGPYEPLIVKYAAMCKEKDNRTKLVGAKGLHAIAKKISLEELAENIWQPVYMDKIIAGLLCCMTQHRVSPSAESLHMENCGEEAEQCMSRLMSAASFGQVASVLNSVYSYLDESNLWSETLFIDHVYHLIMNSIQSRYWSAIVINGISRLQQQVNAPVSTRRNQLKVFCTMIGLMKNQALGALTFDYLNFLFSEIPRITVDEKTPDTQELLYTQDLMDCLESVSTCLAEYETLEVMVFIVNKILETKPGTPLRDTMFRCLYTVTLNYKNRFPLAMFKPLLQLMQEPSTAVMGQAVFHTLLDLHGNLATINGPTYDLKLRTMPFCRPNEHFVRNHDLEIYQVILKSLSFDNVTSAHVKCVYKTLAVMATYQDPNIVVRFFACLLLIQEMAVPERLTPHNRVQLLVATLSLLIAAAEVTAIPDLANYGRQLIQHRQNTANFELNPKQFKFAEQFDACCLIDGKIISEQMIDRSEEDFLKIGILKEISGLRELLLTSLKDRDSSGSGIIIDSKTYSAARLFDDGLIVNDGKPLPEELTFEAMKAVLTEPIEETKRKLAAKREENRRKFDNCSLQDIMNGLHNEEEDKLRQTVDDIIHSETAIDPNQKPIQQILEERFPDIFR